MDPSQATNLPTSLNPKPDRIPCATQNARLRHRIQRYEGHIHWRQVTRRHAQSGQLLAFGNWGQKWLGAKHLRLDFCRRTLWYRNHNGLRTPQLDRGRCTLPDGGRCYSLAAIEQLDSLKCGVTPVQ